MSEKLSLLLRVAAETVLASIDKMDAAVAATEDDQRAAAIVDALMTGHEGRRAKYLDAFLPSQTESAMGSTLRRWSREDAISLVRIMLSRRTSDVRTESV